MKGLLAIAISLLLCSTASAQCANGQCFQPFARPVFRSFAQPVFRQMPRQITQAPAQYPSIQYIDPMPPPVSYAPQPVYRYYYGRPVVRQGTCVGGVCR